MVHENTFQTKAVQIGRAMPLAMADKNKELRVTSIRDKSEAKQFLKSIGFAEDAQVVLISESNGNVIVNVKGTRVAISKAMAMRIYVV